MRHHQLKQRGSANWPFIITLVLLLVFAYMWFDEKDQREQAVQAKDKATVEAAGATEAATAFVNYANQLSKMVGYTGDTNANSLVPEPTAPDGTPQRLEEEKKATVGRSLARALSITDLAKLDAQLTPDGQIAGEPGFLNWLTTEAQVEIFKDLRTDSGEAVSETPTNFEWMTPEFKAKLQEIDALPKPIKPKPPMDEDDPAEVARYQSELAAYEQAMKEWQQAIDELEQMEGFKEWSKVIKGPSRFNPDERQAVKLDFFTQSLSARVDVETLLGYPKQTITAILSEFKKNKEADAAIIDQVRQDNASKTTAIDELQTSLREEQDRHTTDVQQLNSELATANETAESNRLEATQAMQRVTVVEEEMRREVAQRQARINALEDRIRIDKEVRDLKIRRDEPDGVILSSSPIMGSAIINLGSSQKVYPGLKFNVRRTGKGGVSLLKGQVQVTRVLGPNSAKVAILAEDPGNPIEQDDALHNPLWSVTDTVHIFLAGELEKYPLDIAKARLAKLGVVIDPAVNGDTDYIVVPDSMAAPAPAAGGEDEEEDEEAPVGGQSEFERIQSLARTFGATVITEKMLNEFLDY